MPRYFEHSLQSASSFVLTNNSAEEAELAPSLVTAHHHLFTGNHYAFKPVGDLSIDTFKILSREHGEADHMPVFEKHCPLPAFWMVLEAIETEVGQDPGRTFKSDIT
jgi:hypothetical protein